jgi:hypothetical protein
LTRPLTVARAQGYAFQQTAQEGGFKAAVAARDGPYAEQARRAQARLAAAEAAHQRQRAKL